MKNQTKFFTHASMPFVEFRYSNSSKNYKAHIHDTFSIGVNVADKFTSPA